MLAELQCGVGWRDKSEVMGIGEHFSVKLCQLSLLFHFSAFYRFTLTRCLEQQGRAANMADDSMTPQTDMNVPANSTTNPSSPISTPMAGDRKDAQKPRIGLAFGLFISVFFVGYFVRTMGNTSPKAHDQRSDATPIEPIPGVDAALRRLSVGADPPLTKTTEPIPGASSPANPDSLPTQLSPDMLFARCSPAVVQIVIQDRYNRTLANGSGFLVGKQGLIATNAHVIESANSAYVVLSDKRKLPVLGLVAVDEKADLAIIQIAEQNTVQPLELAGKEFPTIGTKVYASGNPLGLANTLSDGLVSGHREIDRIAVTQTTAPISPGSSGGPLLRPDGKVIGLTTFAFKGGQNLNFAIPASHITRLLLEREGKTQLTKFPLVRPIKTIELTKDDPPTLIHTNSKNYVINGLRLGMTHDEAWEILNKSDSLIGLKDVYNPSRISVYNQRSDGSKGETVLNLLWEPYEKTMSKITVFPAFSDTLAPNWRRLLTSESIDNQSSFKKEFIGTATRVKPTLDLPEIGMRNMTYFYDEIGLEITHTRSRNGVGFVFAIVQASKR